MAVLGVTETTGPELSQLIASGVHVQREITLKISAGALKRGTVLEMVSVAAGTWQRLATPANARAILLEDVEDDATGTQKAQAYFAGKYHYEDLIWPVGITTLNKRIAIVALQDRAIITDEAILSIPTTTTTTSSSSTTSSTMSSTSTTS